MWAHAACVLLQALAVTSAAIDRNLESDVKYWMENGKNLLEKKAKLKFQTNTAKNLILFMGDGMSLTTLTAARIYKGQLKNETGENGYLSFEHFPFTGISKTYCVDKQVADSACSATAYLSGVKGNFGTVGVSSKVRINDCAASIVEKRPESIMQWAQWAGKSTGIVTTARVTHASPSGSFAHTSNRNWESDADMLRYKHETEVDISQCEDIARQLVSRDPGRNFKVIFGGGRDKFRAMKINSTGERLDEDLVAKWKRDKTDRFEGKTTRYMTTRKELLNTDVSKVDYLLGLFHDSHLEYRLKSNVEEQPTLQEMTSKAIQALKKDKNGFVLFVEGGLIDIAHHNTYAKFALDETVELSKAVSEAVALTSDTDTLIVVTSDHAHTMTMAGYPARGYNVLGATSLLAQDKLPYSTLSYANGPKTSQGRQRMNVTDRLFEKENLQYPSFVPLEFETHGGEDVMVFARGPWAHLFTGNYEQNTIPLAMAMAAGISTESPYSSGAPSFGLQATDYEHKLIAFMLLAALGGFLRNI
ncbi:membrane-bound alkaline phosphatase-like [Adelges cooleyi]|uniref:membrane-bound alkaline phosphatase-like n=1 Tax=Adelges cooleyi TaxID=133065 RepID=UPI00217F89BB|nr:membrane-bound alkaline phosphatase-like [Adelges cooleyi]